MYPCTIVFADPGSEKVIEKPGLLEKRHGEQASRFCLNTEGSLVHMVTFLADSRWNKSKKVPFIQKPLVHTLQITEVLSVVLSSVT